MKINSKSLEIEMLKFNIKYLEFILWKTYTGVNGEIQIADEIESWWKDRGQYMKFEEK